MANPIWTPATRFVEDESVIIDFAGNVQQCSATGISGALPPSFSAVVGAITADGGTEWTCRAALTDATLPTELVGLDPPSFADLDPQTIVDDMVATFEAEADRPLYPAQIERLLVNLWAYREALVRNAIQYAGTQSLVAFANYPNLDYLGQLVGVTRNPAVGAQTVFRFSLQTALAQPYTRPAGTQIASNDGAVVFETTRELIIPAGQLFADVPGAATTTGIVGNGYAPGAVSTLVAADGIVSVTNTETTRDGAAVESTDHYRDRVQQAPNRFSVAGPTESYRSFALVDTTISDVDVSTPAPGQVLISVLGVVTAQPAASGTQGVVSTPVLEDVEAAVNPRRVRPLCDTVTVVAAQEVNYDVNATVTLRDGTDISAAEAGLANAAQTLALRLARSLKSDIVPEEWVAVLGGIGGVYRVQLSSPVYRILASNEWANCTGIEMTLLNRDGDLLGSITV